MPGFNEYLYFALCYLTGSIPFGIIVAKIYGCTDLTNHGSGNIGATNVVRVCGKKYGFLTFLLDFCKGLIPVTIYITYFGLNEYAFIGALFVVIGHVLPIFNDFRGGKGVAAGFGVLMAINPVTCLVTAILWFGCFKFTRISSAAALFAFTLMPFIFYALTGNEDVMLFGICLSAIIYIRHIDNIKRLLNGQEKAFAASK